MTGPIDSRADAAARRPREAARKSAPAEVRALLDGDRARLVARPGDDRCLYDAQGLPR